jgi:cytochrome c peroxidase
MTAQNRPAKGVLLWKRAVFVIAVALLACAFLTTGGGFTSSAGQLPSLDDELTALLQEHGFTGRIEESLEARLGRPLNNKLINIGRLLWFDTILSLSDDNACAGCHSPMTGFGDTISIAIGVDNNGIVGSSRLGPRNKRRAPSVINSAFFPNLMWDSRFKSLSMDPFDNSAGFEFPEPEGLSLSSTPHLLVAQAFLPTVQKEEMAGFSTPDDHQFIRDEIADRINNIKYYKKRFKKVFKEVKRGAPITYEMIALALAEFQFSLTFANAPIDSYARGELRALTETQKKGALLFFGEARCVECHSVSGQSNEMFSDFKQHATGIPQLVPSITNVLFDGEARNEDYGLETVTRDPGDRYKFRTPPLRNVATQAWFFHNGAIKTLDEAIRFHLDVYQSARNYKNDTGLIASDLAGPMGPLEPVLERVDPILQEPINLTEDQITALVDFVTNALTDSRARPDNLLHMIPDSLPSRRPMLRFQ